MSIPRGNKARTEPTQHHSLQPLHMQSAPPAQPLRENLNPWGPHQHQLRCFVLAGLSPKANMYTESTISRKKGPNTEMRREKIHVADELRWNRP